MTFRSAVVVGPIAVAAIGGAFAYGAYWYGPERFPTAIPVAVAATVTATGTPAHLETPIPLRGIYMTACVAATKDWRESLLRLADETEVNAIVIDVKDYTGTLSIPVSDPDLAPAAAGKGCKVPDMADLVTELHRRGIYAIARVAVFQDPFYANRHPELAIKKKSDKSVIWRDRKGLPFIDVGATPYWDYIVKVSQAAYDAGFDEINLDYIRFPSDGDMLDIYFPWSHATVTADRQFGKAVVVRSFFAHVREAFPPGTAKLSADIFGMTTTNKDDLSIGQILEYAAPYFDYLAPMVYPSHYPKGFRGHDDVNANGYDIVKYSMDVAVGRLVAASTSPFKLRPWLQDNDYPVPYTAAMVREQMQATYDAGLHSWMLWDPANRYTREALLGPEGELRNRAAIR